MAVDVDAADRQLSESTDPDSPDLDVDQETSADAEGVVHQDHPGVRLPLVLGLAVLVALGGVLGWLGYRAYESHQAAQQRNVFLQVGRQAALNLTTISHTQADADVQRILDSATGRFRDDFQQRAPMFVDVVKRAQSISQGTITEAGLEPESVTVDTAQVLVAVSVKTSIAGAPDAEPRAWRMRISVQKVPDGAKVTDVQFVP